MLDSAKGVPVVRLSSALLFVSCVLVSGCSAVPVFNSNSTTPAGSTKAVAITGKVHGGQSPISGAHVYLYAVNDTGYAGPGIPASSSNAAISLLDSPGYVTTASDGSFSITGEITCAAATPHVYLLAVGGDAGSGNNSAITLAAGLGPDCSSLSASNPAYVVINEVSTIAAAYAAAGFATDPTHVSSSSTTLAVLGVEHALAAIVNLETIGTGVANATTPGSTLTNTGTVPQAEINTLANILAACVNSSGAVTGPTNPTPCYTLFYNAENGTTPATDTATAALNIAHNPGANIANLFGLQTAGSPFQPDLASVPNDFTMAITYTGGGLNLPYSVAINAQDDVVVVSQAGYVSAFNPLGVALSGVTGFASTCINSPYGVAIDGSGNVWVVNTGPDSLCEFSSTGVANDTPFTGGGLNAPRGIAIDGSNNIWVTDTGNNTLSEFNSSGPVSSTGYTGGLDYPYGVAIDTSGNVWVTNKAGTAEIVKFNSSGSASAPDTGGGLGGPVSIAFDPLGHSWITDDDNVTYISALSEFNPLGGVLSPEGYGGGGLNVPWGVAVDSNGNVWVANEGNNSISEFNSSGTAISGTNGYQSTLTGVNALAEPYYLAIDGSGNVWVTNYAGIGTITEFVGIAAPVVTPISANLQSPYSANDSAVNRP